MPPSEECRLGGPSDSVSETFSDFEEHSGDERSGHVAVTKDDCDRGVRDSSSPASVSGKVTKDWDEMLLISSRPAASIELLLLEQLGIGMQGDNP